MPPNETTPPAASPQSMPVRTQKTGVGATVGIIIIIILMIFGALYFWGAHLNQHPEQLPLIPGDPAVSS